MILADTGPLVATIDARDPAHAAVVAFLMRNREPVIVPSVVIPEVAYFLGQRLPAYIEAAFLRQVGTGAMILEDAEMVDYLRAADLVELYADLPLGTVDALVIAIAERLAVSTVMTLDRRHFGVVRPAHCDYFEIVP
jgi:predicted nucleic acid-binding protein